MNTDLIDEYVAEYLKNPVSIVLNSFSLKEEESYAFIDISVMVSASSMKVSGEGVGLVDAGFNALINHFSRDYPSLATIQLSDLYFQISTKSEQSVNLKSKTLMRLEFSNFRKNKTFFEDRTTSIGFTAISVLVKAIEFYINSELLFKRVRFLIKDAEDRSRYDVASKLKYVLSRVVEVTSYQDVT